MIEPCGTCPIPMACATADRCLTKKRPAKSDWQSRALAAEAEVERLRAIITRYELHARANAPSKHMAVIIGSDVG